MTWPRAARWLDRLNGVIGLVAIAVVLTKVGFYVPTLVDESLSFLVRGIGALFLLQELARPLTPLRSGRWREHLQERHTELLAAALIAVAEILHLANRRGSEVADASVLLMGITQAVVLARLVIDWLRRSRWLSAVGISPSRVFILSFCVPIGLGTLALQLPRATYQGISWMDALFTVVSAVCVTGLATVDVPATFTWLGQGIILALIQIGGLGIMTLTLTLGTMLSAGLGIRERTLLADWLSEDRIGSVRMLLLRIAAFTITIELVGAALLFAAMPPGTAGLWQRMWYALFHAVSAFCNAGFSLFSASMYDPALQGQWSHQATIMGLIVLGGLGFPVLSDLWDAALARRRGYSPGRRLLSVTTRLVLVSTVVLLAAGTLGIWGIERQASLAGLSASESWWHAAFWSVTARTAGFNAWPTEALSSLGSLFMMALMWIGGSPMSTAGGAKTLTVAVLLLAVRAVALGKNRIEIFGREVPAQSVLRAATVATGGVLVVCVGAALLMILEPGHRTLDLAFEAVSAWGTVGLSRALTPQLSEASKLVVVGLMFVGRMGILTMLAAIGAHRKQFDYKLLPENIPIS